MKKCSIFFFSGTGNTFFVSRILSQTLNAKGLDSSIFPIDAMSVSEIEWEVKTADIIGIGYPVYAEDIPLPVKRFTEILPELKKRKKYFIFCTMSEPCADNSSHIMQTLRPAGYDFLSGAHFIMPVNIPFAPFKVTNAPSVISEIKSSCHLAALKFAGEITGDVQGSVQTPPKKKFFDNRSKKFKQFISKYNGMLSIDRQRCILCGTCVKYCPMQNIIVSGGGISFQNNCVNCMRCVNFCKTKAVCLTYNPPDCEQYAGPYSDFNVEDIYTKN